MERKDIVLKNLAQEISFSKHEFIRLNKLDQKEFNEELESLEFEKVDEIVDRLMNLLKEENPTRKNSPRIPYGNILFNGEFSITKIIDLISKAFKTGNTIIITSKLNPSHSYQFINKAWQSVLASQGHEAKHIQFLDLENSAEIKADLCILNNSIQKEVLELVDFTRSSFLMNS